MPALMPVSVVSSPMASRDTGGRASSKETSVKTAIGTGSEGEHVPHALAGGASRGLRVERHVASATGRKDLVRLGDRTLLRRDADALRLAAHPQLLDAHAVVLGHDALDAGLRLSTGGGRVVGFGSDRGRAEHDERGEGGASKRSVHAPSLSRPGGEGAPGRS